MPVRLSGSKRCRGRCSTGLRRRDPHLPIQSGKWACDCGFEVHGAYTYDGDGRRIIKTSGITTNYLYDPNGRLLAEIVRASEPGKNYLYLLGDPLTRVDWAVAEIALAGDPRRANKAAPIVRLAWTLRPSLER